MIIERYFKSLWDFIFPEFCCACGTTLVEGECCICIACDLDLPRTYFQEHSENPVMRKFLGRAALEKAGAWLHFNKEGRVQSLMHQFKYKNRPDLAFYLGRRAAEEWVDSGFFKTLDFIVAVPLHPRRLRQRGYNQAACIAKGMSAALGIPVRSDLLERSLFQKSQTKEHRFERWQNVSQNFRLQSKISLQSCHILLVDDVITTGATLEACAQVLLKEPELRISVFCLAHA